MSVTRVLILQNIIVPYEEPLFAAMSRFPSIQLKVLFCARSYRSRRWSVPSSSCYSNEVLPGITFNLSNSGISLNYGVLRRIRQERPNVIILSGGYLNPAMLLAFAYGKVSGTPVIYRSDENSITREKSSLLARLASAIVETWIIRGCEAFICPGEMAKEYHIRRGARPQSVFVSPYTTACDEMYLKKSATYRAIRDEVKSRLGLLQRRMIVFVGQLVERKGIRHLLQAFKELNPEVHDVGLILVGDGPMKNTFKSLCNGRVNKRVHFLGFVDEETKIQCYSISDVFVLPSLKDHWGLVVNEAMLCGLPVIVTEATGAKEMIERGVNGLVVDETSSSQLCAALRRVVLNEVEAIEMGQNAQRKVLADYNLTIRAQRFLDAVSYATKAPMEGT